MNDTCKINDKPQNIKELLKSWYFWKPALGVIIGGIGGFLYYYFIGCNSGTCPITSSPAGSILMGAFLGFFVTKGPCTGGC